MPQRIDAPARVQAAGTKPKLIDEYIGWASCGEWVRCCLPAFSLDTVHRDA